jgi:hypothetical protein
MYARVGVLWVGFLGMLLPLAAQSATPKAASKAQGGQSLVIVFKDGHQQSVAMADVERIEFKSAATASDDVPSYTPLGRGHFLGKWELGEGNGQNFYATLDASGEATKSSGASHGTWTVVNGEAHINWDDGWHDAIRKVGERYEKICYPDKTFSGQPLNVANAVHVESKPI